MIKRILLFTMLTFFSLSTIEAVVVAPVNTTNDNKTEVAVEKTSSASAALTLLKSIQSDLETKAVEEGLSKKEQRILRKVNRKVKRYERRAADASGDKNWVAALLLSFFLGGLGIDRFYLGYTVLGIIKLITLGGLGVWALIDFILIIVKALKPKNGEYIEN